MAVSAIWAHEPQKIKGEAMASHASRLSSGVLLLVFTFLLCGFLPRAGAQTTGAIGGTAENQAGSISGTLMDSAGSVLRGAQVSIPAKGIIVYTNQQGSFFFSGLQPGTYALSVSYIGFQNLTKIVTVNPGTSTAVSLQLQVESQKQSVLVTAGSASAEVEAVNEERAADNLIQVMPTQTITSLPDRNLGDAISRMASVALTRNEGQDNFVGVRGTEPRLNNTTVDGFNMPSEDPGIREFDFFAVPTGIVDSVKVSKTLAGQHGRRRYRRLHRSRHQDRERHPDLPNHRHRRHRRHGRLHADRKRPS